MPPARLELLQALTAACLLAAPASAEEGYHRLLPPGGRPAMVLGEASEKEAFSLADYYRKSGYPDLLLWRDTDARDEDLMGRALVIVGTPDENALLARVPDLPVVFSSAAFRFGGKAYGAAAGVVFAVPSPLDAGQRAVVHTGATKAGWLSTFKVPTPAADFAVTEGERVLRRGFFLAGTRPPAVDPARDEDLEALRAARRETKRSTATAAVEYEYLPAHEAALPALMRLDASAGARLAEFFSAKLPAKGGYRLYGSVLEKEAHTGLRANAHSDVVRLEVHAVLAPGLDATGPHELVHLYAHAGWGKGGSRLMEEGAAVGLDGEWWGRPVSEQAGKLYRAERAPALAVLAGEDFWKTREDDAYPLSGHLFLHLLRQYGKEKVRALYRAPFTPESVAAALGAPFDLVEQRWRADLAQASVR